jgi:hypothetical protein
MTVMKAVFLLMLSGCLATFAGCAMCSSCDDYNYGAYGGSWQRVDMQYGRVGSAFTDVGVNVTGDGEELEPEPLPSGPPDVEELTEIDATGDLVVPAGYREDPASDAAPIPLF